MLSTNLKNRSDLAKAFLIPSCQAAREMGFEALNALVHEEIAFKASDWQSSTASSPCGATTRRQTAAGFPSSS